MAELDPELPNKYDILLTDLKEKDLYEIGKQLKLEYLADNQAPMQETLHGIIWGINDRVIVPMVMQLKGKMKNVLFLVDTGSPKTFVSVKVFAAFQCGEVFQKATVGLNGFKLLVNIPDSESHYTDVNLLGADFLRSVSAVLHVDYGKGQVKISGEFN